MIKQALKFLPALALIVFTVGLSSYWLTHQPRAERTTPKTSTPLVEVTKPEIISHPTTISVMGNVIAAQSVNLTPRISGMVTWVSPNFIEGGILKQGGSLVELDPTDYELAIVQSQNDLAKAQFNLKLEEGQQVIVRREYQLLGAELSGQEQELVLRKPHLSAAKAALAAAEAALKQAQLNLERTRPVAPFNAIITTRNANVGAWMSAFSTGTPLAKLVGIDSFWINASIPVDKLSWIKIPGINSQTGSAAKISYEAAWGKGVYRSGTVKRLQAELEPEGRMAKLIIEVDDPLCQKIENKQLPPLMLGTYVRVEIDGITLEDVIKLPETTLHDDRQLWLMTDKQTLDIRTVKPLWAEQDTIYLDRAQLPENAKIITSDLAAPVQGMRVHLDGPNPSGKQ
ncbi:efflux RND transporter periplasmic adaptor subunit [Methyloglobulus sp.]|uniref:efflux RND transporter periplasmic adaptor subunit n=1 Tax=Methyloglobulus sp. TaxID=2518622 RepID=UPI0039893F0F